MYVIESPFRLAMDPETFFSPAEDTASEDTTEPAGEFLAQLLSEVLPDQEDDEDFRELKQTLVVTLPEDNDKNDDWDVSLDVILYLPEDAGVLWRKTPSTCKSSAGTCQMELKKNALSTAVDQQGFVEVSISLSGVPALGAKVIWTHTIVLDDDNVLLPAPFIFSATARQGDVELDWKPEALEKIALPTTLDGRDEL